MARRRLDAELVARGLVPGPAEAVEAIDSRLVVVDGAPALKPGTLVSPGSSIRIGAARRFVSRGGDKLAGALEDLGVDPAGRRCLDAGTGSGGFTDCLLQAGADHVVAVDVGYGQFDWTLRRDPRVTLLERTNLRHLPEGLGPFGLVVGDLSFVSLASMAGTLAAAAGQGTELLLLVKPQFEVPADRVGPGGVIRDPAAWGEAIRSAVDALQAAGLGTQAVAPSRLRGAAGNQEFFVLARPGVAGEPRVVESALEALA